MPIPSTPKRIHISSLKNHERAFITSTSTNSYSEYWCKKLANVPPLLYLPADRPHQPQQHFTKSVTTVQLDVQITHSIELLSQENDVSVSIVLLTAWSAVLARLSGQDDIIIGIPRARNNRSENEYLMSSFGRWLPLRINLSSEPSTIELLEQVQIGILEAQENEDISINEIIERVQPPQELNRNQLFQVTFSYQSKCHSGFVSDSLLDLELDVQTIGDEIVGELSFSTALFDHQTIERHVNYLKTMLQGMIADPMQPVHSINIVAPAERRLLLETWNETRRQYQEHLCIHQLFEQQVERTPNAVALVHEDQILTYDELNMRANRLAHQLMKLSIKPDTRIAICVERSPAMVVGLLSVLKAGGAYVPLDPTYPSNRLSYILKDSSPIVLIADKTGRTALSEEDLTSMTVLDPNTQTTWPTTNPHASWLTAQHLAYVIYTSDSTSNPKGVMVEHQNVVNSIQGKMSYIEVNSSSRMLQVASLSLDMSFLEIFMALSCGARLYLPPDIAHIDRNALWDYLAKHAITHVTLTPAMLQDAKDLPILSSPLTVITRGEGPRAKLLPSLMSQGVFINVYGPTETMVYSIMWRCPTNFKGKLAPIGQPVANTRVYLLDTYRQSVPFGTIGEIYIGGVGVTRGYLNLPEMTAERFLADPFSQESNARMYKTGDLARYLPDGTLVYLGHNDQQVKIQGVRIEVREIEAHLIEHPQVRDATVTTLCEGVNLHLVAYVVAKSDEHLIRALQVYLKTKLPEYKIPACFILLDALPLSPDGTLDYRVLPVPKESDFTSHVYDEPQGDIENMLADIWSALLHKEQIGRHDNFFSLGGHSLLVMLLCNRIQTSLSIEVTAHMVFQSPTIAELAQSLSESENSLDNALDILVPIKPTGQRSPLFCIHAVIGHRWSVADLSERLHKDQPVYYLEPRLRSNVTSIDMAFDTMASECLHQIRQVQRNGPYYLLGWSFGASVAHRIAIQLEVEGESVELLAFLDGYPDYSRPDCTSEMTPDPPYCQFFSCCSGDIVIDTNKLANHQGLYLTTPPTRQNTSPRIFKGDLLFVQATEKKDKTTTQLSPYLWKPYIDGNIKTYSIHCQQEDMIRSTNTVEIARILNLELGKSQRC
ncbi:hypothetical protein K7432_006256 [Basidiobolus ranarum]|uniref:Carrier domain-containing protein n=1 Tax=Basidiobolus ranarum TaxID=34480 RepID=A0ABR2W1X3_9FUNG